MNIPGINDKKIGILHFGSDSAAQYRTNISGWVSRDGLFFGEGDDAEDKARWVGCTHFTCSECGALATKKRNYHRTGICESCEEVKRDAERDKREEEEIEKYHAASKIEWDGVTPVYDEASEVFHFSTEDLYLWLEEDPEHDAANCRLYLCKQAPLREICEAYWLDDMHVDAELPDIVVAGIEFLNKLLKETDSRQWEPTNQAVTYSVDVD